MKKATLLALLCFCAISIQSFAQSQSIPANTSIEKRNLTPEDYKLWEKTWQHAISSNGDWFAYKLKQDKQTTLYLESTKGTTTYSFSKVSSYSFSVGSKWFACLEKDKGLGLLNLETGDLKWIKNVSRFHFFSDEDFLVTYRNATEVIKGKSLWITNLSSGETQSIANVTDYKLHKGTNTFACITDTEGYKSVKIHHIGQGTKPKTITEQNTHKYKSLTWSPSGNALIFLEQLAGNPKKEGDYKLYYYNINKDVSYLKCLDTSKDRTLFKGMTIAHAWWKPFKVSDNGMVSFNVRGAWDKTSGRFLYDHVEVFNTNDKVYHQQIKDDVYDYGPWQSLWNTKTAKIQVLENRTQTHTIVSSDYTNILSYMGYIKTQLHKQDEAVDFYLTNLETGKRSLFLEQHKKNVEISPQGKFIKYFKDRHWWVYDIKKKTHTNITKALGVSFCNVDYNIIREKAYGFLGWTEGEKHLVIYDAYDIWLITPKGKGTRLTRGREQQKKYRVVSNSTKGEHIKLSNGFVLRTQGDDCASGYTLWSPKTGLKPIVYKNMRLTGLKKANNSTAFIYKEESFNIPPRYYYWEEGLSVPKILKSTNPQQKQFYWGHSELLQYKDANGESLQGTLFYPANYNPDKHYPMIVKVYSLQSQYIHHYKNPEAGTSTGFNRTNYTADGYFVFLPDIHYVLNDPGVSAVACVEAGVQAVLKKGMVDGKRIGLTGHSFGGYETAFIISQTDLFASAVAGAAAANLVSWYHTIGYGIPEMRRFEDGQFGFKDSFYKNPEAYYRNSPLHQANTINTPLLLWVGKDDGNADPDQSIALYWGLRRLGKDCELLIYPEEGHALGKPENQLDLTRRIKAWFDNDLKLEDLVKNDVK